MSTAWAPHFFSLLTGKPPFDGDDIGAILRSVQKGAFPAPRQLDPSIDRALEAICKKAMALQTDDRYASPKVLADDLERWMADEPVTAWREPLSRRGRRWARRNRTAVTAALVALVAGLVGLGAVATVQARANGELRAANIEVKRVNSDLAAEEGAGARALQPGDGGDQGGMDRAEWTGGMDMHHNGNDSRWAEWAEWTGRNGHASQWQRFPMGGMDRAEWTAEWTCIAMPTIPDGRNRHPSVTLLLQNGSGLRSMFGLGGSTYR